MEKKEKSIKFNLVMNMLLTTSAFVFPLITFPYITRVLLPEGNGKIAFANSVINYFSMFAMLGIPTYGIRACAQVRDDKEQMSKTAQEIWICLLYTSSTLQSEYVYESFWGNEGRFEMCIRDRYNALLPDEQLFQWCSLIVFWFVSDESALCNQPERYSFSVN